MNIRLSKHLISELIMNNIQSEHDFALELKKVFKLRNAHSSVVLQAKRANNAPDVTIEHNGKKFLIEIKDVKNYAFLPLSMIGVLSDLKSHEPNANVVLVTLNRPTNDELIVNKLGQLGIKVFNDPKPHQIFQFVDNQQSANLATP